MSDRISIVQLRDDLARTERQPFNWRDFAPDPIEVRALVEAVEALNDLMSGIDYSGEPSGPEAIERARQALDRFDFTQAADRE